MSGLVPFGIKGFERLVSGVPPGTCLLFIAPPVKESNLFVTEFLLRGLEDNIPGLFISMDDSPEKIKQHTSTYKWNLGFWEDEGMLKWVDGFSLRSETNVKDSNTIKRISGPLSLSDISIALTSAQAFFKKKADTHKVVFDSVSTLLLYNKPEVVYRFLQVITAKIKNNNGIGLFVLCSGMHESMVEMTIRHLMDGTIRLEEDMSLRLVSFPIKILNNEAYLKLKQDGFEVLV